MDLDGSGQISFAELQDTLKSMKLELSLQMQRNILKIFDQGGDGQIQLEEFERQMSKYFDSGKVEVPTEIQSKIIP